MSECDEIAKGIVNGLGDCPTPMHWQQTTRWLTTKIATALLAEREKVAAKFAAFVGPDGEPRKVVRVVEVGKWPSDYVDRIIDPIGPGDVVFICESQAAEAAKEKKS